jgi:hypothetical protein
VHGSAFFTTQTTQKHLTSKTYRSMSLFFIVILCFSCDRFASLGLTCQRFFTFVVILCFSCGRFASR